VPKARAVKKRKGIALQATMDCCENPMGARLEDRDMSALPKCPDCGRDKWVIVPRCEHCWFDDYRQPYLPPEDVETLRDIEGELTCVWEDEVTAKRLRAILARLEEGK
jgi:predicted  nucleic acid-binding Zn-ribbon protein